MRRLCVESGCLGLAELWGCECALFTDYVLNVS